MTQLRQLSELFDRMPMAVVAGVAIGLVVYSVVATYGRINLDFGAKVFSRVPRERLRSDVFHITRYTVIPVVVTLGFLALLAVRLAGTGSTSVPQVRRDASGRPVLSEREIELEYQRVAGHVLGEYLVAHKPGAVRVVTISAVGEDGYTEPQAAAVGDGLRRAFGAAYRGGETMRSVALDPEHRSTRPGALPTGFTPALLESLADEYAEAARSCVIVSLVGLSADPKSLPFWDRPDEARPALALAHGCSLRGLYDQVASGKIMAAVVDSPYALYGEPLGADRQADFDKRFLLVTPENAAAIRTQFPTVFGSP